MCVFVSSWHPYVGGDEPDVSMGDIFADHPVYLRLQRFVGRPWRASLALFVFAAPPNPLFDVGGIAAGALGIPYRVFFWSVLAARLVRFSILVLGVAALLR